MFVDIKEHFQGHLAIDLVKLHSFRIDKNKFSTWRFCDETLKELIAKYIDKIDNETGSVSGGISVDGLNINGQEIFYIVNFDNSKIYEELKASAETFGTLDERILIHESCISEYVAVEEKMVKKDWRQAWYDRYDDE